jgi:hypothetical protein
MDSAPLTKKTMNKHFRNLKGVAVIWLVYNGWFRKRELNNQGMNDLENNNVR